ncbi:DUF4917 domain-containing protein [Pollutimonas nitritireducens]|uniref:DUF4917 domain-containing protein n=1 Tax=Pollutimonas nitritireducens TaxID=2045209 RepID=A0A2N4UD10_9BURK|nr:DUF4917 family protein [Pollutimonas nitritireducens]PLC52877.1 DUF4917 domain-containing protein [Pollutimonas nitritireducens]
MPFDILQWADISDNYGCTVLLGNGASIAVSRSFTYESLLGHAIERNLLPDDARQLFRFFRTEDFELILRIVWQATNVNRSLQIPDARTYDAYVRVRECLIQTVRDIHPEYDQVRDRLPSIYEFLKGFRTVISLNYDLVVYWAMAYGFDRYRQHSFKDCFVQNGVFSSDWPRFREPIYGERSTTLVFYPHGSLVLCRNMVEQEFKIHTRDAGLLENILQYWQAESVVPLFVSEGTWEQKVTSIQNSFYLSTVYREVLASRRDTLVIYGWGFGAQDIHLLQRMQGSGIRRVAVAVRRGDQAFCNMVLATINQYLGRNVVVDFFDRESPGCWIH